MEKEKAEFEETKKNLAEFFSGMLYAMFVAFTIMGFIGFQNMKDKNDASLAQSTVQAGAYVFLAASKLTHPPGGGFDMVNNRPINLIVGSFALICIYITGVYFAVPIVVRCLYKADLKRVVLSLAD